LVGLSSCLYACAAGKNQTFAMELTERRFGLLGCHSKIQIYIIDVVNHYSSKSRAVIERDVNWREIKYNVLGGLSSLDHSTPCVVYG